ncbi:MAG: precorrin-2 dehydrogenase/sirohydrochlorin ferrochelatase family protein [Leptospirales bacterium]
MSYFPLFADMAGANVLVVGGGGVALRRIPRLLDSGACVTLVSPEAAPGLALLSREGRICWVRRRYVEGDEQAFGFVFALTDDPEVNDRIARRRGGAPTNVATATPYRSLAVPATRVTGGTTLAVACLPSDPRRSREIADLCLSTLSGRSFGA